MKFGVAIENNAATAAGTSPETDGFFFIKIYKPLPSKGGRHRALFVSQGVESCRVESVARSGTHGYR